LVGLEIGTSQVSEVADRPHGVRAAQHPVLVNDFIASFSRLVSDLDHFEYNHLQVSVQARLGELTDMFLLDRPSLSPDLTLVGIPVEMRPKETHPQVEPRTCHSHAAQLSQHLA
jgi:hypothetical protein